MMTLLIDIAFNPGPDPGLAALAILSMLVSIAFWLIVLYLVLRFARAHERIATAMERRNPLPPPTTRAPIDRSTLDPDGPDPDIDGDLMQPQLR